MIAVPRILRAMPFALALWTGTCLANVTTGTPGLTISVATIAAGKLVVTGRAKSPGIIVQIVGTTWKVKSDAQAKFSFNVDYRTPDCRVTLGTSTGTLNFMLSDCGPGTLPRGAWASTTAYNAGDLVLLNGSTYRALKANRSKRPDASAAEWQVFAAKGVAGPQGPAGSIGPKGDTGPIGPQGPIGTPGVKGDAGSAGPQGPTGATGLKGDTGVTGSEGPQGIQGPTGPTGPQGPGLRPRGTWSGTVPYAANDLVLFDGSTYRALRDEPGPSPATNISDWEIVAAKGEPGPKGESGQNGSDGTQGPKGDTGSPGGTGATGPQGPAGPKGDTGATGPQGPQGEIGATGVQGPAGPLLLPTVVLTNCYRSDIPIGRDQGSFATICSLSIPGPGLYLIHFNILAEGAGLNELRSMIETVGGEAVLSGYSYDQREKTPSFSVINTHSSTALHRLTAAGQVSINILAMSPQAYSTSRLFARIGVATATKIGE